MKLKSTTLDVSLTRKQILLMISFQLICVTTESFPD